MHLTSTKSRHALMDNQEIRSRRFGKLKALSHEDRGQSYWWICQCEKYRSVLERRLLSGEVTACVACEKREDLEQYGKQEKF